MHLIAYDRFRESSKEQGAGGMSTSLDFEVVVPGLRHDCGPTMGHKRLEFSEKRRAPGPGQYNPKPVTPNTQSVLFGRSGRDLTESELGDMELSRLVYIESHGSSADSQSKRGFSFTKQDPELSILFSSSVDIPGPGRYWPNESATRPRAEAFSMPKDSSSSGFGVVRTQGDGIQYINPRSSLASTNYQKFARSARFSAGPAATRYHRLVYGSSGRDQPIIKRNMALLKRAVRAERVKRIRQQNEVLAGRIAAAQRAKESKLFPALSQF